MKIAVVYESKYGSTRKYAEWIAEALACDLFERKAIRPESLAEYDGIVYGGGLYAGGVSGMSMLTKNFNLLRGKKLALFTCGLSDPSAPENIAHIRAALAKALTPEMREQVALFHLRGGMDYAKLKPMHKAMMAMLHRMMAKKDYAALRQEDKDMLDTYGKAVDFTDRASIGPLVEFMRG